MNIKFIIVNLFFAWTGDQIDSELRQNLYLFDPYRITIESILCLNATERYGSWMAQAGRTWPEGVKTVLEVVGIPIIGLSVRQLVSKESQCIDQDPTNHKLFGPLPSRGRNRKTFTNKIKHSFYPFNLSSPTPPIEWTANHQVINMALLYMHVFVCYLCLCVGARSSVLMSVTLKVWFALLLPILICSDTLWAFFRFCVSLCALSQKLQNRILLCLHNTKDSILDQALLCCKLSNFFERQGSFLLKTSQSTLHKSSKETFKRNVKSNH